MSTGRVSPAEQCCSFSRSLMAAARRLNYSQIRSNQPSGAGDVGPFRAFKPVLAYCRMQPFDWLSFLFGTSIQSITALKERITRDKISFRGGRSNARTFKV